MEFRARRSVPILGTEVAAAEPRFDSVIAYSILRFVFGFVIFMHGLARFIGGIEAYAKPWLVAFQHVALPHELVSFAIYATPYVEIPLGLLILLGLYTRVGLFGSALLMLVLIFGTSMRQSWSGVETQLFYVLMIALLWLGVGLNEISVDALLAGREHDSTL